LWLQLALTAIALVISVLGVNNPEYSWLVYVCVSIVFIALIVIISESFIGRYLLQKLHDIKNRRILIANEHKYVCLIDDYIIR